MIILALDTASANPSLALYDQSNGRVLSFVNLSKGRGQSNLLLPGVEKAMEEADMSYEDIEAVAGLTGPGSFTGIRVGLSFLKGVALSLDIPCIGKNGFEVAAAAFEGLSKPVVIGLESGRDEKFFQVTRNGTLEGEAENCTFEDFMADKEAESYMYMLDFDADLSADTRLSYDAVTAVKLSQCINIAHDLSDESCSPYYIRPADTSKPKNLP